MLHRKIAALPVPLLLGMGCALALCVVAALLAWRYQASDEPQTNTATPSDRTVEDLAKYADTLADSGDPYFGTRQLDYLIKQVQNPTFDTDTWRISILSQLAFHRLRLGDVDESIQLLTEALELSDPNGFAHADIMEDLAVAHMKRGELRNCVSPEGRLICALPLNPAYAHKDRAGATAAIALFESLLTLDPENVRYRWLLNIARMALGQYPDSVPNEYLIPPDVFAPDYEIGRFEEIAADIGIYGVDLAGGAIIEDFDNDGLLDIMTSTWDPGGQSEILPQRGRRQIFRALRRSGTEWTAGRPEHHSGRL